MIKTSPKTLVLAAAAVLVATPALAHDYHRHSKGVIVEENVVVDAPYTDVRVGKHNGRVAVNAPHTSVRVNRERRRIRIRAPYVNLNIGY